MAITWIDFEVTQPTIAPGEDTDLPGVTADLLVYLALTDPSGDELNNSEETVYSPYAIARYDTVAGTWELRDKYYPSDVVLWEVTHWSTFETVTLTDVSSSLPEIDSDQISELALYLTQKVFLKIRFTDEAYDQSDEDLRVYHVAQYNTEEASWELDYETGVHGWVGVSWSELSVPM